MRTRITRLALLALVALVALSGCDIIGAILGTGDGGGTTPVDNTPDVLTLLGDSTLTRFTKDVDTAAGDELVQSAGFDSSGTITIDANGTGVGTFQAYPAWWDGAIAWVMKPDGTTGYLDLSGVASITFNIKSATILPSELGYFVQWLGTTTSVGGEYAVSLADLGVTDMTDWVEVTVDLTSGGDIPDTTADTVRYGKTELSFFTGNGNQYVDNAFALKWLGSEEAEQNSGPLEQGESYMISDISFLDASGNDVAIADGIEYPAGPSSTATAPTAASSDVISLFNSSATYTNISVTNWNPNWGQAGSITDTTVSGTTLKLLDLQNYQGVEFAATDITGKLNLHLSYYTENGTAFSVVAIDGGAESATQSGAITQGSWQSLTLPLTVNDATNVYQLKFDGGPSGTFWLDNIYFTTTN